MSRLFLSALKIEGRHPEKTVTVTQLRFFNNLRCYKLKDLKIPQESDCSGQMANGYLCIK
jgi:hypothetical protein